MKRVVMLVQAVVALSVVGLVVNLLVYWFWRPYGSSAPRSACQSNLKQIGLAFLQYEQDYEAVLPPARTGSATGWADAVQPYVKSWPLFQCPSASGNTARSTDYFLNARLSRAFVPKIKKPSVTLLLGEGEDDAPTWANLRQLLPRWIADEISPAKRHSQGANYGFADGHVKSFKPGAISNKSPSKSNGPTFAVR